jgi:uncharacterized SAM-binding protein YcdF (DUF218 family)
VLPTWRGGIFLLAFVAISGTLVVRNIDGFLSTTDPQPGGVLVLEGWSPDYGMQAAIDEFRRRPYSKLYVTGGPFESGAVFSRFKTYADFGAAVLIRMGVDSNAVQAVPSQYVKQDRTYSAARALDRWFDEQRNRPDRMNLMTMGAHARRSRLLFRKALGPNPKVGVIAVPPLSYDGRRWWESSEGVRTVTDEAFAYCYAAVFFHPDRR